jgi:8-oxo-dGTP pyrophosphatase MutT (NUDIX family)
MSKNEPVFAPREVFEQILEYAVIPTFDLVIDVPDRGVLIARRRIAPYLGKWALPGLRIYKNESIDDTLQRIAEQETGLEVDLDDKQFLGQYVGNFKTEHDRQDISTGYAVKALSSNVKLNQQHFTGSRFINGTDEVPAATGAMYADYLQTYFNAQS